MNWITTNLRLPEDTYMELKMKAARERKSVAAIIREKLSDKDEVGIRAKNNILEEIEKFGHEMAIKHKGLNLTKALIEMRYEQ